MEFWPFFDLRLHTPRLELRVPTDDDLPALARVAAGGVHGQDEMPFLTPWTDSPAGGPLERRAYQWNWKSRAELAPEKWTLGFMVVCDGTVVGVQDVMTENFPVRREVATGSWLGQGFQGRGIGKEMRAAVLHFAFAGLGAAWACSGAFVDNPASIAVSRALGYSDDGTAVHERRGVATQEVRFRMHRAAWEARRRDDITIEGLEPCLEVLGLAEGERPSQ